MNLILLFNEWHMRVCITTDALYFYVATYVWVRYGAPGEKSQSPTQFFTKRWKHVQDTKSTQPVSFGHPVRLPNRRTIRPSLFNKEGRIEATFLNF